MLPPVWPLIGSIKPPPLLCERAARRIARNVPPEDAVELAETVLHELVEDVPAREGELRVVLPRRRVLVAVVDGATERRDNLRDICIMRKARLTSGGAARHTHTVRRVR